MRNIDVLEAILASLMKQDADGIAQHLHPDFKVIEADGLPYGGVYRGAKAVLGMMDDVGARYWTARKVEITSRIGEPNGNEFVFIAEIEGIVSKTKKPFRTAVAEMWVFKDGKAILNRPFYWDTKQIADLVAEV